jgi:hypothetical protein
MVSYKLQSNSKKSKRMFKISCVPVYVCMSSCTAKEKPLLALWSTLGLYNSPWLDVLAPDILYCRVLICTSACSGVRSSTKLKTSSKGVEEKSYTAATREKTFYSTNNKQQSQWP